MPARFSDQACVPHTRRVLQGLMEVYDADESGLIEFNEFERLYKVVQRKKSKRAVARTGWIMLRLL